MSFHCIRTPRLHLPAPLRSAGITRLHRYYECCDSCAEARRLGPFCSILGRAVPRHPFSSCAAQVSSLHAFHPSKPSVSNHPAAPHDRFCTYPLNVVGFPLAQARASPFNRRLASQRGRIEFAFATDDPFASRCSPPHLAVTQLLSATEFSANSGEDFHLSDSAPFRRTGSPPSRGRQCGARG